MLSAISCQIGQGGMCCVNTLRLGQFGGKVVDDIFKCIVFNQNVWLLIKISLKFVPKGLIDNESALVWVMAWHLQGTNHYPNISWPSSMTHICVIRPQWVKSAKFGKKKKIPIIPEAKKINNFPVVKIYSCDYMQTNTWTKLEQVQLSLKKMWKATFITWQLNQMADT